MLIGEKTGNNGRRLPGNYIDSLRTLVERLKKFILERWGEENKEEGKKFIKSIDKVTEEGVEWKGEILLYWIVMVRNTLQIVGGYSPYQLVFGRNPEILIMTGYESQHD